VDTGRGRTALQRIGGGFTDGGITVSVAKTGPDQPTSFKLTPRVGVGLGSRATLVVVWALTLALAGIQTAHATTFQPSSNLPLEIPDRLPVYHLKARLDPVAGRLDAVQKVRFVNRTSRATRELVFHVYPRYIPPNRGTGLLVKTFEFLRVDPDIGFDRRGDRITFQRVAVNGQPVPFGFNDDARQEPDDPAHRHKLHPPHHAAEPINDGTLMSIALPEPLEPHAAVVVELAWTLDLPNTWGRWGRWEGVTTLANWYPVLAVLEESGWDRSPFVPWHQPWYQEAAWYEVELTLPSDHVVASTGTIVERCDEADGWQTLTLRTTRNPARDFALTASARYITLEGQAGRIAVKVHVLPGREANGQRALQSALEVLPLYEQWFGPYFDDEFEIANAFFGWNGNECAGLVLLDDRVFRMPGMLAPYLDHLVTHETCHQWWWNVVGTHGYAETFMDEGFVNALTQIRLTAKNGGSNSSLIEWPAGLKWLPVVGRRDYRLSGHYGWRARGGGPAPVIQNMTEMGNLETLFTLAYDRGGMVVDQIRNRMGDDAFFELLRRIYRRYAFRILRYDDFKRELDAFDPLGDWPTFLEAWLRYDAQTDWGIDEVTHRSAEVPGTGTVVEVVIHQHGSIAEPTVVTTWVGPHTLTVPILPERGDYAVPGAEVRRLDGQRWRISLTAPGPPDQVEIDPDRVLLDANPDNNAWKTLWVVRLTPAVTPLEGSNLFLPYDRPALVAGPFVDQYGRLGIKAELHRAHRYSLGGFTGLQPIQSRFVSGAVGELNLPFAAGWALRGFYEQGLFNGFWFNGDDIHDGGAVTLRRTLLEKSSLLQEDVGILDFYYGFGNEFWLGDSSRPIRSRLAALGARLRFDLRFPYWDPESGDLIEVSGEWGDRALGSNRDYRRVAGEWATIHRPPESWGSWHRTRLALRLAGGYAWPEDVFAFRLGGGDRHRALNLDQAEGNAFWLGTVEWRLPIGPDWDADAFDGVATLQRTSAVVFYDVGGVAFGGGWSRTLHGVGAGLRADVRLMSFLERGVLRLDLAQPIGIGQGPVLWLGFSQAF